MFIVGFGLSTLCRTLKLWDLVAWIIHLNKSTHNAHDTLDPMPVVDCQHSSISRLSAQQTVSTAMSAQQGQQIVQLKGSTVIWRTSWVLTVMSSTQDWQCPPPARSELSACQGVKIITEQKGAYLSTISSMNMDVAIISATFKGICGHLSHQCNLSAWFLIHIVYNYIYK